MTTPLEAIKAAIEALEPFKNLANCYDNALDRDSFPVGPIALKFCRDARTAHALLSQVEDGMAGEITRLQAVIERDRTCCADVLTNVEKAMVGHEWLRLGRGSYEWNDDRWKDEFGQALDNIRAAIEPLRLIAGDLSDSPRTPKEVKAARSFASSQSPAQVEDGEAGDKRAGFYAYVIEHENSPASAPLYLTHRFFSSGLGKGTPADFEWLPDWRVALKFADKNSAERVICVVYTDPTDTGHRVSLHHFDYEGADPANPAQVPSKSEREAALEEVVKIVRGKAEHHYKEHNRLQDKGAPRAAQVHFYRASDYDALEKEIRALASTPPKPAAEDVVERVANAIAAWRHEALDAFKVCGPRETSRADRSLANTLAAANLLRTDKEPS